MPWPQRLSQSLFLSSAVHRYNQTGRALSGFNKVYVITDPDLLRFVAEDNTCLSSDRLIALR
jgi:hypothetical protein